MTSAADLLRGSSSARSLVAAKSIFLLIERLLAVGVVYSFFGGNILPIVVSWAVAFVGRTLLGHFLNVQAKVLVTRAILRALLERSLMGSATTKDEDLSSTLFDAVTSFERVLTHSIPSILGDTTATVLILCGFWAVEDARLAAGVLAATSLAGAFAWLSRRWMERRAGLVYAAQARIWDMLMTPLSSRLEIVGNGQREAYLEAFDQTLRAWRGETRIREWELGVLSRIPYALAAGAFLVGWWVLGGRGVFSLQQIAVGASAVPAVFGWPMGMLELARARARMRRLEEGVLRGPLEPRGTRPPSGVEVVARDFSFRYFGEPSRALHVQDVRIGENEFVVLHGSNGSGKSTFLRLLLAVTSAVEGTFELGQAPVAELDVSAWRKEVAYLAQEPALFEVGTVGKNLGLLLGAQRSEEIERRAQAMLEKFGLWETLRAKGGGEPLLAQVKRLSVGQRQRLALARVFSRTCRLLLLDEPDNNLDADAIERLARVLGEQKGTRTIVLAAHTTRFDALADRVLTLERPQAAVDE